jgi:hemolysin activation/secretion protein
LNRRFDGIPVPVFTPGNEPQPIYVNRSTHAVGKPARKSVMAFGSNNRVFGAKGPHLMKRLLCLAASWAFLADTGHAQDYSRIAPKPVTPVAPAQPVPQGAVPKAKADSEVLLAKLKGLVFVARPDQVVKNGVHAEGIDVKNVPVPDEADFRNLAGKYLGGALTRGQLNALVTDVIVFYRRHDRPVVDVIVPEQDIATGTVQLVVLEGHVAKITTTGNRWFSGEEIRDGVRFQPGDEISAEKLQDDLDWLNQNAFHTTDVIYHPGEKMGATDLVLQTQDRFPARFYGGYEDSGNAATGFDRYEAGVNWGDAFHLGLGQQLNYQYTTSGDGESLRAHAGSYVIPLPWRNTLTFFGSYTDTKGLVPPLVSINGRSYQISGRYLIPLPTLRDEDTGLTYKESVAAGCDYKYNKNALEFGGLPAGGTLYDVDQFVVSYDGALTDPYGQTTLDDQFYDSPGNWGGNNNNATFTAAHSLATSNYIYDTLTLERLTRLPGDWSLILRGTLQFSDANLVPSEQLGFGGYDTIRGYDEREINADEGYIFSTEMRTPSISIGELCGHPEVRDQLQILGFWDYGAASNHTLLPGEADETPLSSVGAGVRYTINTYTSVRFDYGFQLLRTGFDKDQGSRSDLGIVLSY